MKKIDESKDFTFQLGQEFLPRRLNTDCIDLNKESALRLSEGCMALVRVRRGKSTTIVPLYVSDWSDSTSSFSIKRPVTQKVLENMCHFKCTNVQLRSDTFSISVLIYHGLPMQQYVSESVLIRRFVVMVKRVLILGRADAVGRECFVGEVLVDQQMDGF